MLCTIPIRVPNQVSNTEFRFFTKSSKVCESNPLFVQLTPSHHSGLFPDPACTVAYLIGYGYESLSDDCFGILHTIPNTLLMWADLFNSELKLTLVPHMLVDCTTNPAKIEKIIGYHLSLL